MNGDFVIIGDTERHKDCLVRVIGKEEQKAYEVLNKMMRNPTELDKETMKDYTNLRISFVEEEHCWWNCDID